jgi:hypothetical protein
MQRVFILLAVALSAGIALIHAHVPEAGLAFLLILSATMVLGVSQPKRPWLWALLVGVSLPAAELYSHVAGDATYRARFKGAVVVAIVAGLVGAYGGASMRRMIGNVFGSKT